MRSGTCLPNSGRKGNKYLILIYMAAILFGFAMSESHPGTKTEFLWEDGFPCLTADLPKGYKMKREKCDGLCTFVITKHFYDYPFSKEEKEMFDKIRNQTAEDPHNEAVMHIYLSGERHTTDTTPPVGRVERNEATTGDGRRVIWSTVVNKKMKRHKHLSQALLEDIYGSSGEMRGPAEGINAHFVIWSRSRKGVLELQSVLGTMGLSGAPCRDPRKARHSELQKMSHEKRIKTIMRRLERDEYEFDDDKCRCKISGVELANEEGDVYLIDDLRITASEQIIPMGKKAVPALVRWLRHNERQIRYVAFFSLEIITGEETPFHIFETPDESEWIEKYSKMFLRWHNMNSE